MSDSIRLRRRTIPDSSITEEIYFKLLSKIMSQDIELTQKNITETLVPLKISNNTIARVINDLIPGAKATAGSVAIILNNKRKKSNMIDELMRQLEI